MARVSEDVMVDRLRNLLFGTPDISAAAIVSLDGAGIMASMLPSGIEQERISAMSTSMFLLSQGIAMELARGLLEMVEIRFNDGHLIWMPIANDAILVALVRENAMLGLVYLDLKRASDNLTQLWLD